jgi:hypothetical protein
MMIFIDESGDTGFKTGSSVYFILVAVIFDRLESANLSAEIIRSEIIKNYKVNFEFHFSSNQNSTRIRFLELIQNLDFKWTYVIIDKSKISQFNTRNNDYITQKIAFDLCQKIEKYLGNSKIIFDKKDSKNYYTKLAKYLKSEFNSNNTLIKKIAYSDSHKEVLLQIADYCVGIVNQTIKNPNYGDSLMNYINNKKIP